ncbi:MAG: DUF4838 domain-containing protein [Planctomycetota bacterium]|nr:DUF4838 domain-containing protein [Planctomycetota bacterium]
MSEMRGAIAGVVMSKSFASIFIASALCFQIAPLTGAEVILVKDGGALATIVLAEKPRSAAQLAAHELQYYLERISGAKIPIVREPAVVAGNRILVGESNATKTLGYTNDGFEPQEFLIKTYADTLVLIGRDHDNFSEVDYRSYRSIYDGLPGSMATCYAVHSLLENELGVRWYYPNEELGEVVPRRRTITGKDLNIRRKPDAAVRMLYPLFSNTERLYFTDYDQPEKFQAAWVDARQSLLYWIRLRYWGGMRYNANHSFHGYDKAFGQSHPEWFSTKSFGRMQQLRYQGAVQPCLTADGFLEQVVEIAREHFDGKSSTYPDTNRGSAGNFFSVVPNDNTNMCNCASCTPQYRRDLSPGGFASHYVWGFVNNVAREVRKTHPDAMVSGLAYFNYTVPPRGMTFEPNVSVTFCKFYQQYHDRDYQRRDYERIAEYVNRNKARFFTTWEYPVHPFMNSMPFPCLVPRVQADDVRCLTGIDGFMGGLMDRTSGAVYQNGKPIGVAWSNPVMDFMNVYWRVKLYDDFDFDIEQGLAEYYHSFFGPAAAEMEKFYTALETRWMSMGGASALRQSWWKLGTKPFLDELAQHMRAAMAATRPESIERKRVDLVDAGIMQYLIKARAKYEGSVLPESSPIATAGVAHVAVPADRDWTDDSTWADALPNPMRETERSDPAVPLTVFKLAYDSKHVYLYARCPERHPEKITADTHDNDHGGFKDDSIELFIDPTGRGAAYYHFCINTAGAVYDALRDATAVGAAAKVTWDSNIQVKATIRNDHWELRAALPLDGLGIKGPLARSTWRFNIARRQFTEKDRAPRLVWSPLAGGGSTEPGRFGIITFNAPADRGRLVWNCDLEGAAFAGQSRLIGVEGWYENTNYANLGWDKSWKVVRRDGNRVALGNLNQTNFSDLVPKHAVQISPGIFSVEVAYRRGSLAGNMPALRVQDRHDRTLAIMYTWPDRPDLVGIEQSDQDGGRQNFGNNQHGIDNLAPVGQWFGMKLIIDTTNKRVNGYVRRAEGEWVKLNASPLPYYDHNAQGSEIFLGLGSRKLKEATGNTLEMDNIRVIQLSCKITDKH